MRRRNLIGTGPCAGCGLLRGLRVTTDCGHCGTPAATSAWWRHFSRAWRLVGYAYAAGRPRTGDTWGLFR